jgi:predicted RND superfamily exporter protein
LGFVRKLFKPVFLAALTTFAGFISFSFAPLKSIRDFGVFASFGVFVAFAVAITLIPAILLIRGQRTVRQATRKTAQRKTRVEKIGFNFENKLAGALGAVVKMKTPVLVITAVVVTVSVVGASKIIVDNSLVEFFNDSSEVSRADRFIRERFGGSKSLILSVEADNTNDLLSPETLSAIDGLSTYLIERVPRVTRVTGFTDMIKRMNQLFNMDESPEGLSGVVGIDTSETSTDTFGFGDFGIEDTDEGFSPASSLSASFNGGDTSETIRAEAVSPPSSPETPISFSMLNTAVGKRANMSANELVRELERMTNYEGYSYYEIPTDPARYGKKTNDELRQLVSNYLVLLSGKTNDSLSNDPLEPTAIMTVILIDSQWQKDSDNVIRAVNNYVEENFPKNVRVLVGGGPPLEGALADLVFYSQMISIITSILIILVIVALSYKSFAAGLIAALPLTIATIGNFAVMGFFGITINIATALIASLAVGIGIDYTIHFIDAFKREYKTGGDYLYRTLAGTGKAILINAVSVGAGFCVLVFSQFRILAQFGGLIALSMGISAVVSLTVIPVLLTTVKPKFIYGNNRQSA